MALTYVGQPLNIAMAFSKLATGAPADPGLIDLAYTAPDGTTTPIPFGDLVHDGLGAWHYVLQTTGFDPGDYVAQLSCSGGLVAVCRPRVFVLAPQAVPGL